jgi:hypothetical protein
MAARIRKNHQDEIRQKIQVSQLINVLTQHALGGSPDISASRMKAIEILLKKSLPDLSAIEMTGPDGGPLETINRVELVPLSGDRKG